MNVEQQMSKKQSDMNIDCSSLPSRPSLEGRMDMLTFAHPWIFWLAPLPLIVRWFSPPACHDATCRPRSVSDTATGSGGRSRSGLVAEKSSTLVLRSSLWLLVLTALARPQWLEPPIERSLPTRDLLLLVDLSGSMDQQDFTNATGQSVNRLTAVKEVLGDFLTRREGDRVGLVVFGTAPFLQVPFTTDLRLCRQIA